MNAQRPVLSSLSQHQHALLRARAKREAMRLREQAIAAFWSALGQALRRTLHRGAVAVAAATAPRVRRSRSFDPA